MLTDQVEAQGEKIRDLESSLEEHHHKLNSTEEMLQQVRDILHYHYSITAQLRELTAVVNLNLFST